MEHKKIKSIFIFSATTFPLIFSEEKRNELTRINEYKIREIITPVYEQ